MGAVKIALIQMSCSADPAANLDKALARAREAASSGAQIIGLQELFRSQYFCHEEDPRHFNLAEPVPGPTTKAFSKLAQETKTVIICPLFERRTGGLYHNTVAVIDADGTVLGKYRKMHIPHDPHFYEKYYFTPGDLGFRVFETQHGRIASLICWDQWFPEGARLAALAGAQILYYPTAIGWLKGESDEDRRGMRDAWQTVQRSHAITNGLFVAAANRVGIEHEIEFWGSSFVVDPMGRFLARGGEGEEILYADCDLNEIEATRRAWPFLRDRRIDAYGGLTRRYLDED